MSNKPRKDERGGEVQPDKKDHGPNAGIKHHKYGAQTSRRQTVPGLQRSHFDVAGGMTQGSKAQSQLTTTRGSCSIAGSIAVLYGDIFGVTEQCRNAR